MISSGQDSTRSQARRTALEEEQFLCREAVRTGDFDAITDSEWVAMCERVAGQKRLGPENSDQDESVPVG